MPASLILARWWLSRPLTSRNLEGGWYRDSYVRPAFSELLKRRYSSERLATHMVPYAYD
jgi:hypothetical protein